MLCINEEEMNVTKKKENFAPRNRRNLEYLGLLS